MEKRYCIYMYVNKVNGKVYIGQTCQKPEKRWGNGKDYKHNNHFTSSIEKYGWDNFEHIIIEDDLTQEEANEKEYMLILLLDAKNPKKGYNKIDGGKSSPFIEKWKDESFKEKIRKQQSELMKQRWQDPIFKEKYTNSNRSKWTNEMRLHMSDIMTKRLKILWEDENYQRARSNQMKQLWKNENRDKLIKNCSNNAKKNWKKPDFRQKMCKSVKNIETGLIFESAAAAARWCGLADRSGITKFLTGKTKSAGKHPETKIPLHWEYYVEVGKEVSCCEG